MKGKEAFDKIFDKLTYDQQQELGEEVLRIVYQDLNRLEKLEKAIKILKKHFNCNELYGDEYGEEYLIAVYECNEEKNKIISGVTRYITQEEYELLKEVLGNE